MTAGRPRDVVAPRPGNKPLANPTHFVRLALNVQRPTSMKLRHEMLAALLMVCLLSPHSRAAGKDKPKDASSKPAKIKVNVRRGYQDGPVKLTLATDATEAKIFYTTDGRAPTPERGQSYREGIQLTTTTSLRVAGFRDGQVVTEVDTHTFLFLADML